MKCFCLSTTGVFQINEAFIVGDELTTENLIIKLTNFFCEDLIEMIPFIK